MDQIFLVGSDGDPIGSFVFGFILSYNHYADFSYHIGLFV